MEYSRIFPFVELKSALKYNPVHISHSIDDLVSHLETRRGVAFVRDDSGSFLALKKHCGFRRLKSNSFIRHSRLVFRKNTTFLKDINRAIVANSVEITRITKKYLITLKHMHYRTDCIKQTPSIGLVPYLGIGLVCLAIITIAFVTFFAEFGIGYDVDLKGIRMFKNLLKKV
jgi:hypothetical protein